MPRVVPDYKVQARHRILDAAITVFAQKGYHRTKMEDIAKHLGVSKGALYQYFPSKQALFRAVVNIPIQKIQDEPPSLIINQLEDIATPAFYEKFLEIPLFFAESTWPPSLMFEILSEASRNPELAEVLTRAYNEGFTFLETYLENQKQQGRINPTINTHYLAMGLIALQDGLQGYELFGMKPTETSKAWVAVSTLILQGVRAD
ncbi:MAG: TetR/AcrR family transcriptional regulator [Promethearchaeota archaeon]